MPKNTTKPENIIVFDIFCNSPGGGTVALFLCLNIWNSKNRKENFNWNLDIVSPPSDTKKT
mgnify:CR=1 FL=1